MSSACLVGLFCASHECLLGNGSRLVSFASFTTWTPTFKRLWQSLLRNRIVDVSDADLILVPMQLQYVDYLYGFDATEACVSEWNQRVTWRWWESLFRILQRIWVLCYSTKFIGSVVATLYKPFVLTAMSYRRSKWWMKSCSKVTLFQKTPMITIRLLPLLGKHAWKIRI